MLQTGLAELRVTLSVTDWSCRAESDTKCDRLVLQS